jgi:predicted nucleotidyltransferase component of viral defense system
MIPRAEVSRQATTEGLPQRTIEHDYCLTWVLTDIGHNEWLRDILVFKGGTCLRKVYFPSGYSLFRHFLRWTTQADITAWTDQGGCVHR